MDNKDDYAEIKTKYNVDTLLCDGRFSSVYQIKGKGEVLKIVKNIRDQLDILRERDILQKVQSTYTVHCLKSDLELSNNGSHYVILWF